MKLEEYEHLKKLFNNSLVGTSKLLHFLNPEKYAIWDSNVFAYLRKDEYLKNEIFTYRIDDVSNYRSYLKILDVLTKSSKNKLPRSRADEVLRKIQKTKTKQSFEELT